jgi:hypothetical protein
MKKKHTDTSPIDVHAPTDDDFILIVKLAQALNREGPTKTGQALLNTALYAMIRRDCESTHRELSVSRPANVN